ncbi:SusC/RagA family TonB-linked outer membrane protein [Flavimarina sp. Hel_I_48]|uniref:SusC/RagA family TonB-linked outer membrane protein n=1 Tax=Flavimarina sp. Hel_I_48 TaxID=1392488 RepID=UPI0013DA1758|nr:SusC/RagA family TonB-linked outer membrane protein [Flavimarina sp. Hel_I_48]
MALVVQLGFAQIKTITGTVTDDGGVPLPGVNILVKGSSTGTQTDFDGNYSIEASQNSILVFSYVGFQEAEVAVGTSSEIDMELVAGEMLEEVVINALGIEVNRATQASSVSEVAATAVQSSGETSIAKGLAGKASGVQIISSSGDAGSSAFIQIRGQSTITRSLQPLIVVDGIPISNEEVGAGVGGVTQQSRLGDLNPNDIADVKILKGASAAALWGARAGNGVVVITTKKGKGLGKGSLQVSISSTVSYDQTNDVLDTQSIFGQGTNGSFAGGTQANSWGDKISLRSGGPDEIDANSSNYFVARDGTTYYPIISKNSTENFNDSNYDAVINQGLYLENNVSLSGATESGNYFMSVSDLKQDGIIDENDYNRVSLRLNGEFKLNDKIKFTATSTYSQINSNRIQQGSNTSGLLLGLYRGPADFDIRDYIGTRYQNGVISTTNSQRSYRRGLGTLDNESPIYNNPLWTTNIQSNPNTVERYIMGGQFNYKATDWMTLIARAGLDHFTDERKNFFPKNSAEANGSGSATERLYTSTQSNIDFIAQGDLVFSDRLSFGYLAGLNFNRRLNETRGGGYTNFILDSDKFFYTNAVIANRSTVIGESEVRITAGYAQANLSFDDLLFLNLTGRAETASTYGDAKTFFYPSAELGFQFNKLFDDQSTLSNGKLRLTFGKVGIEPAAYATNTYFENADGAEGYGPAYDAGAYDGSFVRSTVQGNANLEPEKKTEYEGGIDLGFFNNRFTLGATYYYNETTDALFTVAIPGTTGFSGRYDNAASLQNEGLELDLSIDVIRSEDFVWNVYGNFSTNENEVTSLTGTESLFLNGFTGVSSRAVEGQPVGVLWGGRYAREDSGSLILDDLGFPTVALTEGVIGDPNPDWRAGIGTSFSFKGFTISTLFDASVGGDVWDGTNGALNNFGRTPETANEVTVSAADAETIIAANGATLASRPQAVVNADGSYTIRGNIRDFGAGPRLLDQAYYTGIGGGFGPVGEQFIYDGSWVKWRQLTLSYNFVNQKLKETLGLKNIELSLTGRNLLYWSKHDFGQDPESNLTGASNGRGLQYFNNPNTRSYLGTLTINF